MLDNAHQLVSKFVSFFFFFYRSQLPVMAKNHMMRNKRVKLQVEKAQQLAEIR